MLGATETPGPLPILLPTCLAVLQVAAELGKPLVLEEFGKNSGEGNISSVRDPWFALVQGSVDASLQGGGPLRGALFWQWDGDTGPRIDGGSNIREVRGCGGGQRRVGLLCCCWWWWGVADTDLGLHVALLAAPHTRTSWPACLPLVFASFLQYDSTFNQHISPFAHKLAGQPPQTVPGCAIRGSTTANPQPAPDAPGGGGGAPGAAPHGAYSQLAGRKLLQQG